MDSIEAFIQTVRDLVVEHKELKKQVQDLQFRLDSGATPETIQNSVED